MQSKYSNSMCLVVHVTEDWRWWVTILPFSSSVQFSGKRNLSISTCAINDQFSGSYYNVQPAKFKNSCLHFILPPPIEPREITDILQTFFFFCLYCKLWSFLFSAWIYGWYTLRLGHKSNKKKLVHNFWCRLQTQLVRGVSIWVALVNHSLFITDRAIKLY